MTATSPCKPIASSHSATGAFCATKRCVHEYSDNIYPEVFAAEQEADCGDHPGGDPVLCPDLWSVPAGSQLPESDDRPRDLYVGELARQIPRRALPKREIYHRQQRCPDGYAQRLARERHLRKPKHSSALSVCHGIRCAFIPKPFHQADFRTLPPKRG